jgi:hypothetical protein
MVMVFVSAPRLPDGREIRALTDGRRNTFTQAEVFGISRLMLPSEGILRARERAQAVRPRKEDLVVDGWLRCSEYAFFHKDPKTPLGKEIIWIEDGVIYKKLVPDVPVKVGTKVINLQKAVGMGVYESIGLLKIEQTDDRLFVVSVVDPSTLIGKVRVVDFMRDGWALADECGLPIACRPSTFDNPNARYGMVGIDFDAMMAGYHGSLAVDVDFFLDRRIILAGANWSEAAGVAVVERECRPRIRFVEYNGQSPYRNAPQAVEAPKADRTELGPLRILGF